jgi:hypothetical protein
VPTDPSAAPPVERAAPTNLRVPTQPRATPADKHGSDAVGLMRNRFDELGKDIGREALGPSGATSAQDQISLDAQYADLRHDPDPARTAERARLGLLGRIASSPCLIELYSHAPDPAEFRACLGKHIAFWQQRAKDHRKQGAPPAAFLEPSLWIIAARTPASLLAELALAPVPDWPPGVYAFGGRVLHVRLVAASELPRDPTTLLVRLMAGGPLLPTALAELSALPEDAHERTVAGPILLRFRHALEIDPIRMPEEKEIIVAMQDFWSAAREEGQRLGREEGQRLGREEGQRLGRAEAKAHDVLTVLRVRGIPVPDAARERILAETDLDRLERWLERAIVEPSLAAILDEPS